jgi:hypothetical protein
MGPHRQTVFDQLDLEIIDQVYAAAWAELLVANRLTMRRKRASGRSRYAGGCSPLLIPARWTSTCSATGC